MKIRKKPIFFYICLLLFAVPMFACSYSSSENHITASFDYFETTTNQESQYSDVTVPQITIAQTEVFSNEENEKYISRIEEDKAIAEKHAERFQNLEDVKIDWKTLEQVNGDELKSKNFAECSIGVLDYSCIKVYGYLSEKEESTLIECIAEAEISAEEYGILPLTSTGGNPGVFKIDLSTDEKIYVGTSYYGEECFIVINGRNYPCDKESVSVLRELYNDTAGKMFENMMIQ